MVDSAEVITAETARGRDAILDVMAHAYTADIESVPPRWARARVVDGVPVSYILVDPDRRMAFPAGEVPFAFICDVATREERRGEGHFRALMGHTLGALRAEGLPLALTHGRYPLYRRFGFDVFTHHSGIWATPELLERTVGTTDDIYACSLLEVDESPHVREDLLTITEVRARTPVECRAALQAAAALARARAKARILFEHPAAPSYGSLYPIYDTLETPFNKFARACGARVCVQAADPEGSDVPHADWIRVLDAEALVRAALRASAKPDRLAGGADGSVALLTDAGAVTLTARGGRVTVTPGHGEGVPALRWPSSALAQLVTGFRGAQILAVLHDTPASDEALAFLDALFPRRWRLSRNEGWVYRA